VTPAQAAARLAEARHARATIDPFTDTVDGLDEAWAYAAQAADRRARLQQGEQVIGAKLGLTSVAKQQRMGVDRPIVGFLTDRMLAPPDEIGGRMTEWAQPRIEPEVAFVTSRPIDSALDLDAVRAHIATVGVAAEVIDSRWTDYRFRLPDVVADNTSAAGVVLGSAVPLDRVGGNLAELACTVSVDGQAVHETTGAAILGDPLLAVQLLSHHLERRGEVLPAGSLVLAGALTDAVPLAAGHHYRLAIEDLGDVSLSLD
jgi:2-oxo-3-hexenedioate decarboxylase